jgi:hypothetical protein
VAEASLRISIDSMSFGLSAASGLAGAVGGAAAVAGARGGGVVLDREAVDHVERLVAPVDRRAAADADRHAAARRGRGLGDLHAGGGALERLLDRGHGLALDVGRHRGDRAGDVGAPLRAVADDDDLLERGRDLAEREVERDRLAGGDLHGVGAAA